MEIGHMRCSSVNVSFAHTFMSMCCSSKGDLSKYVAILSNKSPILQHTGHVSAMPSPVLYLQLYHPSQRAIKQE